MFNKLLNKITWLKLAVLVFVTALCITFLAWNNTKTIIKEDRSREFEAKVEDINSFLQGRISTYNDILYNLQGLFAASVSVERHEWSPFVKTAKIALSPDIEYISFVQVVPNSEKETFTTAFINDTSTRSEGYPDLKIYPDGVRDRYAVVKYIEPESDKSIKAYGLDLYSDTLRKAVLDKAQDTGKPQISEKISIVPDNVDGFIISAPIYQNGVPHNTLAQKRSTIIGFVQAIIKTEGLFNSVDNHQDISFAVYDTTGTDNLTDNNLLYATSDGKYSRNANYIYQFSQTKTIKIDERTWTLKFIATPKFGSSFVRSALPLVILIGGISLSTLLFLIFYLQGKSAQERIKASETRYRRLFEAAQDGILILDAYSGKIVDVNPFLKVLLGYSKEQIIGKRLWQIGVFKNIADSKAKFLKLQDKGFVRYEDLPLQTSDGRVINVEFVSNVYYVDSNKVIQCNIRDITIRKKAEEEVKARNKQLEALVKTQEDTKKAMLNVLDDLETAKSKIEAEKVKAETMLASIGDGVVATDSKARVIMINKSAQSMLHCKSADVVGKKFFQVCTAQDNAGKPMPTDKLPIHQALSSAKVVNTKSFYVLKDGTKFPVALTVTPIFINKKIEGAIEVFRDITKETEINRAKTEFVSLASHQLRTPLGIIKWYLESVRNQKYFKDAPKKASSYLEEIYKNNERIIYLVHDLLSVSRIDQGRVKDNPESIDIVAFTGDIVRQMNILAAKSKVKLKLAIKLSKPTTIFIDKLRLREVIENLIVNAIEYNTASGKVEITIGRQGDGKLLIEVKDSGIGISPQDQKKLFTKFFRTKNAVVSNTEGSGLGLYVVKSYVEGWGGEVAVKSKQGKGSTFRVTIPFNTKNKKGGEIN